jgi:hypothetical protein
MAFRLATPQLDFIVIGAQKAGTTSLWRYLEDNPALRMPPDKEALFFSEPCYPDDWRAFMRAVFKAAPRAAKLGTVTPPYMVGTAHASVPTIAQRIHSLAPDVRLVALLRDPVQRAHSAHRMLVRRGEESRPFGEAVADLIRPEELRRSRTALAHESRSYVVAGEYGRMLEAYLEHFDRDQLHVELSDDLDRDPAAVVNRVCTFLGVAPHVPGNLGERFHRSGRRRVSEAAEAELKAYMQQHVWPRIRHAEQHRGSFEHFFAIWNVEPEPAQSEVGAETAARLRDHYAKDARTLETVAGVRAPWVASSDQRARPSRG